MPSIRTPHTGSSTFSPTRRELLSLAGAGLLAPGLLYGCGGGGAAPTDYSSTRSQGRAAILKALAEHHGPSASVALVDRGQVVWAEAFGVIDKATQQPPTTDTMFGIGSVSKMISTIATMVLVDRQLVELDAPLTQYVSDFRMASPDSARITVRMLLNHSSGFPGTEYRNSTTEVPMAGYARQTEQTLATARLKHAPGEMAVYCNDGFAIAELVVAAATGKPYVQFVQDEILTPLRMEHSGFTLTVFPVGSYAPGYRDDVKQPLEVLNCYGGGGLYSTPSDMARVAMMLINGGELDGQRILSPGAVAEMARDQTASLPFNPVPSMRFGLGWDGVTQGGLQAVGVTTWHKNGGSVFYGSELFVAPQEQMAVFITATSTSYNAAGVAETILLHALADRGRIAGMPALLPNTPLPERTPTAADMAAIAGWYGRHDMLLRIDAQPDRTLAMLVDDQGQWRQRSAGLKLRADGTWSADAAPHLAWHTITADGRRYLVMRSTPGYGHVEEDLLYGQAMAPQAPLSAAWQARAGRTWLTVNEHPLAIEQPLSVGLHAVPDLPGYVVTDRGQIVDPSGDDTRARMCLKIPILAGTDLNDVVVDMRNGQEWLRLGSALSRPQATVPALAAGSHTATIGAEGYGEWFRLPASGTVSVANSVSWKVLDADLTQRAAGKGSGSSALPGSGDAAYLLVYGAPGAGVGVTVA
ncbi:serine hydrolase domain-containing protein [Caenimonas terrae]|uniref:Serine hydrolase domain-containing protein n=1 Tax=Caenimonas terrae TaxID=696074 RepID=A0ABW0NCF3_9BURK